MDNDFLTENIGIGEIFGFFETFVSEPENVKAGFGTVPIDNLGLESLGQRSFSSNAFSDGRSLVTVLQTTSRSTSK